MSDSIYRHDAIKAIETSRFLIDAIEKVMLLPSAQPEIIYCKDCKWKQGAERVRFADVRPFPSDFCSRAERREE